MPLLIVCGRPCSGKSTFASALCASLSARGCSVELVRELEGEERLKLGSPAGEKVSRARFKAGVERALVSPQTCVVADGCNSLKGFRYELHVVARYARTSSCARGWGPTLPFPPPRP